MSFMESTLGRRLSVALLCIAGVLVLSPLREASACGRMWVNAGECLRYDGTGFSYMDCDWTDQCSGGGGGVITRLVKTGECTGFPIQQCINPQECECGPAPPGKCGIDYECEIT